MVRSSSHRFQCDTAMGCASWEQWRVAKVVRAMAAGHMESLRLQQLGARAERLKAQLRLESSKQQMDIEDLRATRKVLFGPVYMSVCLQRSLEPSPLQSLSEVRKNLHEGNIEALHSPKMHTRPSSLVRFMLWHASLVCGALASPWSGGSSR